MSKFVKILFFIVIGVFAIVLLYNDGLREGFAELFSSQSNYLSANLFLPNGYDPSLTQTSTINEFSVRLINWVLTFLAILSIIMIIYGGFLMVASRGDEGMYGKGLDILKWTIIGIIVILASYAIVNTVINFLNGEDGTGDGTATDSHSSEVIQVYLQASPTEGSVSPGSNQGVNVIFDVNGSKDLTRNYIEGTVDTYFFLWYGDETDNQISANAAYNKNFGLDVTCNANNTNTPCIQGQLKDNIVTPKIVGGPLGHVYQEAGSYTAKFSIVSAISGQVVQTAYATQTISITNESIDYSVPAPTAGFVYEVVRGGSSLVIDVWSTSFDRNNGTLIDTNWNNTENHGVFGNHEFYWDFDLSTDTNGDGDKLNDHDLIPDPDSSCGTPPCWNFPRQYPSYSIEYVGQVSGTESPPKYRITYDPIPSEAMRIKLKVKDKESKREDSVIRTLYIPDNILTANTPPTAFFGYMSNPGTQTIQVFNRSFDIQNNPLVSPNGNTNGNTVTMGDISYIFEWDVDSKSEKHPISITEPIYSGTNCTQGTPKTLNPVDDGITDNDIDSSSSALFVENNNDSCPIIFSFKEYGTYNLQLTVIAKDKNSGDIIAKDVRIIAAELTAPDFPGPEAAFITDGVNPNSKIVQFRNTSQYFDINIQKYVGIPSDPALWDLDGDGNKDINIIWDFDTLFDSDGNGNNADDQDQQTICNTPDPILQCDETNIIAQAGNKDLFSPARTFKNIGNIPSFETQVDNENYQIKLTISQKNIATQTWYTDTIVHSIFISTQAHPVANFTYSQDNSNDLNIFFKNLTKDSNNTILPDGTIIYWDFDTNTDSNQDGNTANDHDEECTIGSNGTTCLNKGFIDIIDTVSFAYNGYGRFKVRVNVSYPTGENDSFEQFVQVRKNPNSLSPLSAFTYEITDDSKHEVSFTSRSVPGNGGTLTYEWDFDTSFDTNGDGNNTNDIDDPVNNISTATHFAVDSLGASGGQVTYSLDIPTANVQLTTIETLANGQQIRDTINRTIQFRSSTRFAPPQANFKIEQNGTVVEFLNFSTDNRGNPLSTTSNGYSFSWDFNLNREPDPNPFPKKIENSDQNTSNDIDSDMFKPNTYDYQQFGTYSVKLTVTNPSGLTDSKTVTIDLDESQTNPNIIAKIAANPTEGFAPLTVDFTSSGSQDKNGTISSIMWDFGDNSAPVYDQTNVTHVYEQSGHYRAGLVVSGPSGKAIKYIFINVVSSNPKVELLLGDESPGNTQDIFQATVNTPSHMRAIIFDPTSTDPNDFSYAWNVFDGTFHDYTTVSAAHTFTELGEGYEVKLTITNTQSGLATTVTRPVKVVNAPPEAKIIATSKESFSGISSASHEIYFADVINASTNSHIVGFSAKDSIGAPLKNNQYSQLATFEWDFGDGSDVRLSSNINEEVVHTYTRSGTFTVTLKVTDETGLVDRASKIVMIADSNKPVPRITIKPSEANTQTTVTLDASQSYSKNGDIHEYRWIIGEAPFNLNNPGIQLSGKKVQKKFSTPSSSRGFDVQISIIDSYGEQTTLVLPQAIIIKPQPPVAQFEIIPIENTQNEFLFDASSSTYDIGINPNDIKFEWNFGDGSSDYGKKTNHIFELPDQYTINLTVTDGINEHSTAKSVKVTSNLIAKITNIDPVVGKIGDNGGLKVMFQGDGGIYSHSGINNASITGGTWNFGDGSSETVDNITDPVEHVYTKSGHHTVTFSVYDNQNNTASSTFTVHIGSADPQPLAVINDVLLKEELQKIQNLKNHDIQFSAIQSLNSEGLEDVGATLLDYTWDFGDGGTSTDPEPIHQFKKPGQYIVKLTVRDISNGKNSSDKISFTIKTSKPIASFNADPLQGTSPLLITFDASNSIDNDGTISQYIWDFGDNSTTTTTINITNHIYKNTGDRQRKHTVTLKVVDDDGETSQMKISVTVDPQL